MLLFPTPWPARRRSRSAQSKILIVASQGIHTKLLNQAAQEILVPLGLMQRGPSRMWFHDHGWWLVVVSFESSSWSKGSYLDVAAMWLWDRKDYVSFDVGGRVERNLRLRCVASPFLPANTCCDCVSNFWTSAAPLDCCTDTHQSLQRHGQCFMRRCRSAMPAKPTPPSSGSRSSTRRRPDMAGTRPFKTLRANSLACCMTVRHSGGVSARRFLPRASCSSCPNAKSWRCSIETLRVAARWATGVRKNFVLVETSRAIGVAGDVTTCGGGRQSWISFLSFTNVPGCCDHASPTTLQRRGPRKTRCWFCGAERRRRGMS